MDHVLDVEEVMLFNVQQLVNILFVIPLQNGLLHLMLLLLLVVLLVLLQVLLKDCN